MGKIKKIVKENKYLYFFVRQVRKIQYYYLPEIIFRFKRYARNKGFFKNGQVERIKDFKNKHSGDRCFIIATGPSLRIEDVERLSGEFTFGMNSISKLGDKTKWRPTYYGIQDLDVYRNLKENILRLEETSAIFISNNMPRNEKIIEKKIVEMPIYGKNHRIDPNADNIEFSTDCYDLIYDGYTITYTLLQLAVYMGFEEIYLLGADTNYAKNGPQHFIETGVIDPHADLNRERMIRSYKTAKAHADNNGVKIFNATRGGYLEVFERIDFNDLELKSFEGHIR